MLFHGFTWWFSFFLNNFYFSEATLSMWDFSSPTRDQTRTPCIGFMDF